MAFKRTYRRRYRRTTGRRLNRKQKKQVKKLISIRQELKYQSAYVDQSGVSNSGSLTSAYFDIAQGDSDTTRDGDRLMWCGRISLRGYFTVGDETNIVRLILFQWHPNSVPNAPELLMNGTTGAIDVMSMYAHDTRQQFRILYDKTWTLAGNGGGAGDPITSATQRHFTKSISLRKAAKQCQFVSGTTQGTNKFYIYTISDSSLPLSHPLLTMTTKIFFRDS